MFDTVLGFGIMSVDEKDKKFLPSWILQEREWIRSTRKIVASEAVIR